MLTNFERPTLSIFSSEFLKTYLSNNLSTTFAPKMVSSSTFCQDYDGTTEPKSYVHMLQLATILGKENQIWQFCPLILFVKLSLYEKIVFFTPPPHEKISNVEK